jgi:hypothetical protein
MAHSSKLVGAFVKAIFVIALSVQPMWLTASVLARAIICSTSTVRLLIVLTCHPAIAVLSTGYRPLGSCSRPTGWSAATLCFDPDQTLDQVHSFDQLVREDAQRGWHLYA